MAVMMSFWFPLLAALCSALVTSTKIANLSYDRLRSVIAQTTTYDYETSPTSFSFEATVVLGVCYWNLLWAEPERNMVESVRRQDARNPHSAQKFTGCEVWGGLIDCASVVREVEGSSAIAPGEGQHDLRGWNHENADWCDSQTATYRQGQVQEH